MDRRLSGRTVSITIDLPIELAEYLAEDGMQLIATVQHAVRKFKRNPSHCMWPHWGHGRK